MNKIFYILAFFSLVTNYSNAFEVSFTGLSEKVLEYTPDKSTGLDEVFVIYDSSSINEMIISGVSGTAEISRYSNLGGGFAETVNFSYEGNSVVIRNPEGDMGYIIRDSQSTMYIWIVNYLPHNLVLNSAYGDEVQECENTRLDIIGEGSAIYFYTIDGRPVELSREIEIGYNNLEWEKDNESFIQNKYTKYLNHLSSNVLITPPLYCNSTFTISGDRFLKEWNKEITIESSLVYANGLAVETKATQTNMPEDVESSSNVIKTEVTGMGGSAPVDIEFRAFTTDAVIHNEWQIASDEMFDYVDFRFNEQNLNYTFNDEGTYYVRFVGSNSDGTCEIFGETYTIGVGASELKIPNAFTPNEDGINDVWKVSYRSLIKFHCSIFDRYGNEIYKFNDPSQGWDGKYKGKTVKPGVYFYVIEAEGADGKKYKKGGDINIIKSKRYDMQTLPN